MRIGVLKPDHLGDFVLSAPAIAALRARFDEMILYCHPGSVHLAKHLFPTIETVPILFPHLDKKGEIKADDPPRFDPARLDLDLMVPLRSDGVIDAWLRSSKVPHVPFPSPSLDRHIASEQSQAVSPLAGRYDPITAFRYLDDPQGRERPREIRRVGLCISAGFPLNAWPLSSWLELGERLHRRGISPCLLGGPEERSRLRILGEALGQTTGRASTVLIGGPDTGLFLRDVAESVDLVIATDSGTAHLASLVRPVLSLFGGSPWRRYAPLGPANLVVHHAVECSPCFQFDRRHANLCHSQECLVRLLPGQAESALEAYLAGEEFHEPSYRFGVWLAQAPWRSDRN